MAIDTPDIPALRVMSAERLAVGDIYYGSVQDQADQRKGWAVIEQEGQEVADVTNYAGTNRVDVIVNTPKGILTLAMLNDTQVIIEHKRHPNAVDARCTCDDSDVYDGYAECSVHPRPTDQ